MRRPAVIIPAALAAGILAWSEWSHWRASTHGFGTAPSTPGREAILVLGCRNRGTRANHANRYRVRVALRSVDARATETVLVFCGGPVGSRVAEADLLLDYARRERGFTGASIVERLSTTTWENIANTVDAVQDFDTIKIASNSLHAEKARGYLRKQRPDLAPRLVPARDYRFGEIPLVKVVSLVRRLRKSAQRYF